MSYRQSNYDPLATAPYGAPLKPFNRVQRVGSLMVWLSAAVLLALLAAEAGLIAISPDHLFTPTIMLGAVGSLLVNSRRQEIPPEEQEAYRTEQRRRTIAILAVAVVAAAIGAAAFILSKGAN